MQLANFEEDYKDLIDLVVSQGERRSSRVGDTMQIFGTAFSMDCMERGLFPILTGRQMFWKPVIGELTAFLSGATDLNSFRVFDCKYWDANAKAWNQNLGVGDDDLSVGRIYGAQWREWRRPEEKAVDQLQELVASIQHNPMSRRHILTAWNPGELDQMCLPPCHIMSQYNVRAETKHLDCIVYMRSVDLCLGLPSDIILYATLLIILAKQTGYAPGVLTFMMADTHVYVNHLDVLKAYTEAPNHDLPPWRLATGATTIDSFIPSHFELIGYNHEPKLQFPLNV